MHLSSSFYYMPFLIAIQIKERAQMRIASRSLCLSLWTTLAPAVSSSNSTATVHNREDPSLSLFIRYPSLSCPRHRSMTILSKRHPMLLSFPLFLLLPVLCRKSNGIFLLLSAKCVTCVTKAIVTIMVDRENKLAASRGIPRFPID